MLWLISLVVVCFLFLHFYLPRTITEIENPLLQVSKGVYNSFQPKQEKPKTSVVSDFEPTKLTWQSHDGLTLYAQFTQVEKPKATVLLLHGIQSSKERYNLLMPFLAQQGYNSISVDLRAHGESDGKFCTFGVNEKKDIKILINQLEKNQFQQPFGIWGHSLGGAVSLQAMAVDSRLKFGVVESTFSDFKTIVDDYFSLYIGFSFPLLTNYLANRAGRLSNFDYLEASPINACRQIEQPVLMVHGSADQKISIRYGKANFDALQSANKKFISVKNGSHDYIWQDAGEHYFDTVVEFLDFAICQ